MRGFGGFVVNQVEHKIVVTIVQPNVMGARWCEDGSLNDARVLQQREQLSIPVKINVACNPANTWWRSSISAWFPARNFEILAVLTIYNLCITLFVGLSNVCGDSDLYSVTRFCDERWVFANADFLSITFIGIILLLALRTHMAICRHHDIRRQWDKLESACRNLCQIICFHGTSDREGWARRRAVAFIKAFPITVKLQLRDQAYARSDLGNILVGQDIRNLMRARSMPHFCIENVCYYLAERVSNAQANNAALSNCIVAAETTGMVPMVKVMGSLETARKQPLAMAYCLHIRFIIIVFLVLYPLHMVVNHGYITILVAFFLDYIILGLESVVTEYESTFGYARNDMDLDAFCENLSADLEEILVRVEHESRDMIFDTWQTARKNEEMLHKASSGELGMLTAMQRKRKQGRAQFVRGVTKGLYNPDGGLPSTPASVSAEESLVSKV